MSDRGLPEFESLQIISDEENTESDTVSERSSEDEYDTNGFCYYCHADLDYEEDEYQDPEACDRFYCKRCYDEIFIPEGEIVPCIPTKKVKT